MMRQINFDEFKYVLQKFSTYYVNKRTHCYAIMNRYDAKYKDKDFFIALNDSRTYDTCVGLLGILLDIYTDYDIYKSWLKTLSGDDFK